jgi:hypothetical protein
MGYRTQNAYDEASEAEWRKLPLRDRYNWPALGFLSAVAIAIIGRYVWLAIN